jgi:DnaK suppressor protein
MTGLRHFLFAARAKEPGMFRRNLHTTTQEHVLPAERARMLRGILLELRRREVQRLRDLVRSEAEQKDSSPGDELDDACKQDEMELQASLIEISEMRLAAIQSAVERLEDGGYGICEGCGDEISFERLRAMPMALHCVDCQTKSEAAEERHRK